MRKLFILLFVSALFVGCGTMKQVQVVERVSTDTLYLNHIQYDSIYIDNWQLTDRSKDTVYVEKVRLEYKYKLLRDTVYKVQIDSIPVIREVEVIKTERYIPKVYKATFWICIILFCVFCVFCVLKIKF